MVKKKALTKEEAAYVGRVVELGCIVCRRLGYGISPAEAHHPRFLAGTGQRAPHKKVIPLCPMHHRIGGYGVALHAGQKTWEKEFDTEAKLLEEVELLLGDCDLH